jgi:hypothetical protein
VKELLLDSAAAKGEAHIVWIRKKLRIDKRRVGGSTIHEALFSEPFEDGGDLL